MKEYKIRIADQLLAKKLEAKGAVLVQGAKWCGKTTATERYAYQRPEDGIMIVPITCLGV